MIASTVSYRLRKATHLRNNYLKTSIYGIILKGVITPKEPATSEWNSQTEIRINHLVARPVNDHVVTMAILLCL